jgi:hypothetical protein
MQRQHCCAGCSKPWYSTSSSYVGPNRLLPLRHCSQSTLVKLE